MDDLELIVKEAQQGSATAIEALVIALQGRIYSYAVKFFWNPQDAEEATQEAFIKIITRLESFRGESKFSTWAYKVASNHFLNMKQVKTFPKISFETFEDGLGKGLNHIDQSPLVVADNTLVFEAKAGCSLAMLQCLDHQSRLVYVLGEVLEFSSKEGAFILDISDDDFRQKLHRSRHSLHAFMNKNCGLVSKKANCRCSKQVAPAIQIGKIKPQNLLFNDFIEPDEVERQIDSLLKEVEVFHLTNKTKKNLQIAKHIKSVLAISIKSGKRQ